MKSFGDVLRLSPQRGCTVPALAATLALCLWGCSKSADSSPAQSNGAAAPSTVVELTAGQLHSIKIDIARYYPFAVQKEAVGSIAFSDELVEIQAESALLGAAATYKLTLKELARVRSLGTENGIAQKELEQATSDEETAEAALKAARDAVRALGITDAEIDEMISSGRIESHPVAHLAAKWATAYIVESDSVFCHPGQAVEVRVPAIGGRVYFGTLTEVYAAVDPNAHRVFLRAQINDPDGELRPGMLADVVIDVDRPIESIAIPESGVVREGDGTMTAWVTSDRRHFAQRIVTTGLREDGRIQILQGLRQGDEIVTDGAILLDNMLNAAPGDD
jgi:membrane fusion protein, heavy metal efflux system